MAYDSRPWCDECKTEWAQHLPFCSKWKGGRLNHVPLTATNGTEPAPFTPTAADWEAVKLTAMQVDRSGGPASWIVDVINKIERRRR